VSLTGLLGLVGVTSRAADPSLPPRCPQTPTCSTYAIKALHRHGAWRGTLLSVRRLLGCKGSLHRAHSKPLA
jgi:putative component of membrane protein insertase Oxa1/YidC/SpoIIIJ protein YidD